MPVEKKLAEEVGNKVKKLKPNSEPEDFWRQYDEPLDGIKEALQARKRAESEIVQYQTARNKLNSAFGNSEFGDEERAFERARHFVRNRAKEVLGHYFESEVFDSELQQVPAQKKLEYLHENYGEPEGDALNLVLDYETSDELS